MYIWPKCYLKTGNGATPHSATNHRNSFNSKEEEEEDLFTKQNMYTNDKAIMAHSQVKYI